MPLYRVTENPPPFKQGNPSSTVMNTDANVGLIPQVITTNRLTDFPIYKVIQSVPIKPPTTIINTTTIVNNTTIINPNGGINISAEYFNTLLLNNISTRTLLINNGGGTNTYDDSTSPIWDTALMKLKPSILKEVFDVSLKFTVSTDTLGGAFEVEAFSNIKIDIIEEEINIQQQDYTIRFKLVADQRAIDNGIYFFITPELGMTISITDYSLLVVRG
jgi:hypothetical protein